MILNEIHNNQSNNQQILDQISVQKQFNYQFGYFHSRNSDSLAESIENNSVQHYHQIDNNKSLSDRIDESIELNNDDNILTNMKQNQNPNPSQLNDTIFLNLFSNQIPEIQKNIANDNSSPILDIPSIPITFDIIGSNCTTNLLNSIMTDKIRFQKVDQNCIKQEENNSFLNNFYQFEENKNFDIFSCEPLKMRAKKIVQEDNILNDIFEDQKQQKKKKNLEQLNHVVEQAESIVVDLSDREDDFNNSYDLKEKNNNLNEELPLILQPSFLMLNKNIDQSFLQSQFDFLPLLQNNSNVSQNSISNGNKQNKSEDISNKKQQRTKRACKLMKKKRLNKFKRQKVSSKKQILKSKTGKKIKKNLLRITSHSSSSKTQKKANKSII